VTAELPSQLIEPEDEAAALRRCMRDLVALSTLPAAWVHADALGIAESLVEVVLRVLNLDVAFVRVPHAGGRLEAGRTRMRSSLHGRGAELGRLLEGSLGLDGREPPPSIPDPDDGAPLQVALTPVGHDRECGWFVAASRRADFPSQHERLLLGVAVNQLVLMLQRKSAEALLRDEAQTLETLNRVGESLAAELSLERVVQQVTDAATGVCGAQFGAFFYNVLDEKGESYQLYALSGASRESFSKFSMPRNTAVFAPTFAGVGVVRSDDIRKDPRYGRNAPHQGPPAGHLPVVSYLAVPVVSRSKEVMGGLFFGHAQPGMFNERAERLVAGIAAQAAIAIDNARLYERLRGSAARLAEADRRKDEFLATLAHELRNPLAPLRNGLQILRLSAEKPELAEPARAMMERQLEHMVRLVDDLLDMSRISTGKIDLRREWAELGAIVHSARESAAPLIEREGHLLKLDLPPEPVYLDADPVRLAQVFCNLLNNAAKYTQRGGQIVLSAARRDAQIEVSVRDNGIGISPATLPRVFDMFIQGEGSAEKSLGGLGIGLTIVKQLVELHGGTVQARSDGLGCGSEFIVRLPLLEPSTGRRPPAAPRASTSQVQRRILVVDDNADAAASLAILLGALGHEVHTADDGEAALTRAETLRPDLILLDIGMPKMNGYDACKVIRSRRWSANTQLVALSGWGQEEHKARARDAGFDHYLVKPVSVEALERVLASLPAR
jgi:signal transduction histidine kinase/CheY-like chemotaxis protein